MQLTAVVGLWTVFGLVGFLAGAWNAYDDWRDLPAASDQIQRSFIRRRLLISVAVAVVEGIIAGVGIHAIFYRPTRLSGQFLAWSLVTMSGVLAAAVAGIRYSKWALRRGLGE
jgi:hypothetical protein